MFLVLFKCLPCVFGSIKITDPNVSLVLPCSSLLLAHKSSWQLPNIDRCVGILLDILLCPHQCVNWVTSIWSLNLLESRTISRVWCLYGLLSQL